MAEWSDLGTLEVAPRSIAAARRWRVVRSRGPRGCACSCHAAAKERLAIVILPHAVISTKCG